jgi:hypothetical protein
VYRQSKVYCNSQLRAPGWTSGFTDNRLPAPGHTVRDACGEIFPRGAGDIEVRSDFDDVQVRSCSRMSRRTALQ